MGLMQAIYMDWIWEFSMRREEGTTADTTMKTCILEKKQESHSEGQKKNLTLASVLELLQNETEPWENCNKCIGEPV